MRINLGVLVDEVQQDLKDSKDTMYVQYNSKLNKATHMKLDSLLVKLRKFRSELND